MSDDSLVRGVLTAETWKDFVERLRFDCEGDRVNEHCTANAIFIVQDEVLVIGIDPYCTDKLCYVVDDGDPFFSPEEYWRSLEIQEKKKLNLLCAETHQKKFLDLPEQSAWSMVREVEDGTITGWDTRLEPVSFHMTHDAAQAWIKRKAHDYRKLAIFVEAQTYCWEYNAIKQGILNGTINFNADSTAGHTDSPYTGDSGD